MKKSTSVAVYKAAILLLASFIFYPAAAAGLYKWVDKHGNVTYQSSPPPDDARTVETPDIRTGGNVSDDSDKKANSKEGDKKAEKNETPVVYYSRAAEECASCEQVREYFQANDIPFDEINLTEDEEQAAELEKRIGYNSAPTFSIGEIFVSGFNEDMLTKILEKQGYAFPPEEE